MDGSVALDNMNYAPIDELDPIIDEQPQGTMNGNSICMSPFLVDNSVLQTVPLDMAREPLAESPRKRKYAWNQRVR